MTGPSITDFLRARYVEARAAAEKMMDPATGPLYPFVENWSPGQWIADLAAKHAIVDEYAKREPATRSAYYNTDDTGFVDGLECALELLTQPYRDHPDFDPAWATDTAGDEQ